jgi:hypothetical protein
MAVQLTKVSELSSVSELNHTLANTDRFHASLGTSSLSSAKVTFAQMGDFIGTYGSPLHTAVVTNSAIWTASIDGSGTANYIPKFDGTKSIANSILYDDGDQIVVNGTTPNGSNKLTVNGATYIDGALAVTGAITSEGDITAFSSSDKELKDNIVNIEDALTKVESVNGVKYTWNDKSEHEGEDVGVIAQEIEEILPEVVATRGDGYKAVRYEKLVPLLIEAVKELSEKVKKLEGGK